MAIKRRYFPPSREALTADLHPLVDTLEAAWDRADAAEERVRELAQEQRAKQAQADDDAALKAALEAGKKAPANLTRAADQLAAERRIAAAELEVAQQAEAQAAQAVQVALRDAAEELIEHNLARAEAGAEGYQAAIAALLSARKAYLSACKALSDSYRTRADRDWHEAGRPVPRRDDPLPMRRTGAGEMLEHPTRPIELRVSDLPASLEHEATKHLPDPRLLESQVATPAESKF